jgi:hypothetical protein
MSQQSSVRTQKKRHFQHDTFSCISRQEEHESKKKSRHTHTTATIPLPVVLLLLLLHCASFIADHPKSYSNVRRKKRGDFHYSDYPEQTGGGGAHAIMSAAAAATTEATQVQTMDHTNLQAAMR